MWIEEDNSQSQQLFGFLPTAEVLLNDFIRSEGEGMIGVIFRNSEELNIAMKLADLVEEFLNKKGDNLSDEEYITDPDWLPIVATARHALRLMNSGDK